MTEPETPVTEEPATPVSEETPASSGPAAPTVEEPAPEPTVEEPVLVDDPETAVNEAASDAELRAWASANGIEGVPASGRLSAAWREQITTAMAAALDPKEEASADATSSADPSPSTPSGTEMTTTNPEVQSGEDSSPPTEPEEAPEPPPYRTPWVPEPTWVSSQFYTA